MGCRVATVSQFLREDPPISEPLSPILLETEEQFENFLNF